MTSIEIGKYSVGSSTDPIFIVAEIGQNHQGNIKTAMLMIDEAKRIGCNCVKFQKSSLDAKFTKAALTRPYTGKNSWGATYGEHKAFIEFSIDEFKILQKHAQELDIIFSASAMDEISLCQLNAINVPFIKIGSGDANNYPLLKKAASLSVPLIISTGMQTILTIQKIVQIMQKAKKTNFALLHCISSYPTKSENCNLLTISLLKKMYPNTVIGYSGHEANPKISEAAVLLGAKIIERHFTLSRSQKGSDHICSLTPQDFSELITLIRHHEKSLVLRTPQTSKFILRYFKSDENIKKALQKINGRNILDCELECHSKLGKSLVTSRPLRKGQILSLTDIAVKVSEPLGMPPENIHYCLGKEIICDLDQDVPILFKYFRKHKEMLGWGKRNPLILCELHDFI